MAGELCKACDKPVPRPTLVCMQCAETYDTKNNSTATYYCDTRCKVAHQLTHQDTCKNNVARTRLVRASALLQDVFHCFRLVAFDLKIKRVEKRGGILHAYEDEYTDQLGDGPAFLFPFKEVVDKDDKAALLTHLACNDALGYMYELSRELLGELTTTIEEVKLSLDVPWKVLRYFQDGRPDYRHLPHATLAVEGIDGEAYIIDMAGSQFGQHRSILPLHEYMYICTERVLGIHAHGDAKAHQIATRQGQNNHEFPEGFDFRTYHLQHKIHQRLLEVKQEWEAQNGTSLVDLTRRDHATWCTGKAAFTQKLFEELAAFLGQWRDDGCKLTAHPEQDPAAASKGRQPACTVQPQGSGSRAYQRWLKDTRSSGSGMPKPAYEEWLDKYRARGANIHYF